MAKYVIEIPDEKIYAYVNEDKTFLRVPISAGENNIKSVFAPTMLRITPYTELDEDERYGVNRYKAIGLAFLKWLGNDVGDKLKSADDVYQFLDKNCCNKDAVEQEVWEFARKMISMSGNEVSEMWGCATNFGEVMYNTTYSEAKAKYEEWQKQNDERPQLESGQEWIMSDDIKCTLLDVDDVDIWVLNENGCVEVIEDKFLMRFTGRIFPEVDELLKKMREE